MATWHQQRNPVPLWHETLWTVVIGASNKPMYVMRFETKGEAQTYLTQTQSRGDIGYIVSPGVLK